MSDHQQAKDLAKSLVDELLDSKRFRQVLREIVLRTAVELDEVANVGKLRSFLRAVEAKGMRFYLTDKGQLRCKNASRLTPDLKAVLTLYWETIIRHLEKERDLEKHSEARYLEAKKREQEAHEKRTGVNVKTPMP